MVAIGLEKLDLAILELPTESRTDIKIVALLRSEGLSAEEIAPRVNLELGKVELLLNQPEVIEQIFRFQRITNVTIKQRVKSFAHDALETKVRLMKTSTNDAVKNSCATDILDRSEGKAVQTVVQHNFNTEQPISVIEDHQKQVEERLASLEAQRNLILKKRACEIKEAELIEDKT